MVSGPLVRSPGGISDLLNCLAVVPLAVVVALAVGAAAQARFGEEALVELALFAQGDFRLEDVDFARQLLRHLPGELLLPLRIRGFHLVPFPVTMTGFQK